MRETVNFIVKRKFILPIDEIATAHEVLFNF